MHDTDCGICCNLQSQLERGNDQRPGYVPSNVIGQLLHEQLEFDPRSCIISLSQSFTPSGLRHFTVAGRLLVNL